MIIPREYHTVKTNLPVENQLGACLDEDDHDEQLLSITWYNCMAKLAMAPLERFVDPDVPLDVIVSGRLEANFCEGR